MTSLQRRALLATIIGSGVVFLDGSVVNLALPKMASTLGADFSGQQWVVDGYLLTLSALILLGGSLGDIFGRKKVYLTGVVGFGIASLLCGLSPTIGLMVFARMLQGVFGALMVPGALAIINTNFPDTLRGKAIGQWTAWTSGIIASGPLVGGWLVDNSSWRWIFFMNIPLVVATVWLGLAAIKETKAKRARSVDARGALLAVGALGGLTYGLIEGPATQWAFISMGSVILGGICLAAFVWYEGRVKDPMLPLGLFRSRNFAAVNLTTFAMYGALGGFFFVFSIYLQTKIGFSAIAAGLSSLPVSIILVLLSGRAGQLAGRYGPRLFMTVGPILAGMGVLTLMPLQPGAEYIVNILPSIVLFGIGLGLTVAPLTSTVFASVDRKDSGIASAVNNAVSRVSGLVVIALLGVFGAGHAYTFAAGLCGALAIGAGLISFVSVRNPSKAQ